MSKRIILELVYPGAGSGAAGSGSGQGNQQPGQLPGTVSKASGIVENQKIRDVFSKFGQSVRNVEQTNEALISISKIKTNDTWNTPAKREQLLKFTEFSAKREMDDAIDKSMEIIPEINKQYKEDALKAQVTAAKSSLKSINKKIAPVLHYSTQAFALYHKNQMNTYQMSGMTSAAIRQQQFAQGLSLAQEITTTSIAFMINPILGAAQLLMSTINRVADYQERSRVFEYNKAKDEYSANYYRNRLVNNMRVVI